MKSGWRYELRRGKYLLLKPIKCVDVVDIKSKLRRWELSVSFHYQECVISWSLLIVTCSVVYVSAAKVFVGFAYCSKKNRRPHFAMILGGIPAPSNFGEDWKRRAQGCVVLDRHRANNKGKGYLFDENGFDYTKVAFMRDTKA
ncbi:hypothetical protein MKW98_008386 [Papaver atlanticum]|uniref:Uncharacterized protein n=1 Tax=Papaver atlanticum TaxID=357466 RepID=A0AAD4XDE4_9MAGN|nr:hypothetical protein MKW98_008386 [Papaver atlanticum]